MRKLFGLSDRALDYLDGQIDRWEQRLKDKRHADDNEVLDEPVFKQ